MSSQQLKDLGFSLIERKQIEKDGVPVLTSTVETIRQALGADWNLIISWASIAASSSKDKVLRALYEVLLPGLKKDVSCMGEEELAALAAYSAEKSIEVCFDGKQEVDIKVTYNNHFVLAFNVLPQVDYHNQLCQYVLNTCPEAKNPQDLLPSASLGKSNTDPGLTSLHFEPVRAKVQSTSNSQTIGLLATSDRGRTMSQCFFLHQRIIAIEQDGSLTHIHVQGGQRFLSNAPALDIVGAVEKLSGAGKFISLNAAVAERHRMEPVWIAKASISAIEENGQLLFIFLSEGQKFVTNAPSSEVVNQLA